MRVVACAGASCGRHRANGYDRSVRTHTVLLALACLAVAGCGRGIEPPADVNAAYSEFLNQPRLRRYFAPPPRDILLVLSKTVTWHWRRDGEHRGEAAEDDDKEADSSTVWARVHARFSTLKRDTYEDFWAKNAEPKVLTLSEAASRPVRLVTKEEVDRIFGNRDELDGWAGFRKAFPRSSGIIRLSAVGFSRDGEQALLYFSTLTDWLEGLGSYYLLARTETGWKIAAESRVWMLG